MREFIVSQENSDFGDLGSFGAQEYKIALSQLVFSNAAYLLVDVFAVSSQVFSVNLSVNMANQTRAVNDRIVVFFEGCSGSYPFADLFEQPWIGDIIDLEAKHVGVDEAPLELLLLGVDEFQVVSSCDLRLRFIGGCSV